MQYILCPSLLIDDYKQGLQKLRGAVVFILCI